MIRLLLMNDTKKDINERQQLIWRFLQRETAIGPSHVLEQLQTLLSPNELPSLITVKRDLDVLTELGYCTREGAGRATGYRLTQHGVLLRPFDLNEYVQTPPDTRARYKTFDFTLFNKIPSTLFDEDTTQEIEAHTTSYRARHSTASQTVRAKELERFVIELSWKSSAIEGNTYSLLDTERLLKEGILAPGHDPAEATMIINHKTALRFVTEHLAHQNLITLNQRLVEQIHELLVTDLDVATGPRKTLVGITGSAYTPLDNQYQIREALDALYGAIERVSHPVEKALLALVGISYIQPFEDGNKRTARLASNLLLIAHNCAPLSYRNVDIERYRSAMLVFYEQLSLAAVQEIFLDQYRFSAKNYLV